MKLIKEIKKIVENEVFDNFQLIKKIDCLQLVVVIGDAAYNSVGEKYSLRHPSINEWQGCEIIIVEGSHRSFMVRGEFIKFNIVSHIREAQNNYYTPNDFEKYVLSDKFENPFKDEISEKEKRFQEIINIIENHDYSKYDLEKTVYFDLEKRIFTQDYVPVQRLRIEPVDYKDAELYLAALPSDSPLHNIPEKYLYNIRWIGNQLLYLI